MKIFNKKLNDRITLVSIDNDNNELVLSIDGMERKLHATTLKCISNGDYVLYNVSEIGQVYDYSRDNWRGKKCCYFDLRYKFSNRSDSRYAFLNEDLPIYIINDLVNDVSSYTYDELFQYTRQLEQELADIKLKLIVSSGI